MTGWKKHRQDELWTRQLFLAILLGAPGACLNRGWWKEARRGRGGEGCGLQLEVTRLDGLSAANLSDSKAHALPSSLKKVFFPPEGTGRCGTVIKLWRGWRPPISPRQCSAAPQPDTWSNSYWRASSTLVSHQRLRSGCSFSLSFFVPLHCFSASYVLIQSNTRTRIVCEVTLIYHWLLCLNSQSNILTPNSTFIAWTFNSITILSLNLNLKKQLTTYLLPYSKRIL